MKKLIVCTAFLAALFTACATSSGSGGGIALNQALEEAAAQIDQTLQTGTTIAPLNFVSGSPNFSAFVLDGLTSHLVRSGQLTVVSRGEVELASVRGELAFQHTGDVSNDTMQEIGQMLGAQSIISGQLLPLGGSHRLIIRVVNVQNAQVEVMYAATVANNAMVTALLADSQQAPARVQIGSQAPAAQAGPSVQTAQAPGQAAAQGQQRPVVIVEGQTLAQKFQWLADNAQRNTEYRIEVAANENLVPQNLSFAGRNNITIRMASEDGARRTITHTGGTGSFFTVGSGVELVLSDVILHGRSGNNAPVVTVEGGGSFVMGGGARITGNVTSQDGGGVVVARNAIFTMNGGEITGNTAPGGGGVVVAQNASFTMTGGEIFGNRATASWGWNGGGGVNVNSDGNFTMRGGAIFGNSASADGGGVRAEGYFTMSGGEISGNTATRDGGGVNVSWSWGGGFRMTGGEIAGNIARSGGGVFLNQGGGIQKTGGVIYGSGSNNGNRATGNVASHAVGSNNQNIIRISTAGPNVSLNTAAGGAAGGWEN